MKCETVTIEEVCDKYPSLGEFLIESMMMFMAVCEAQQIIDNDKD